MLLLPVLRESLQATRADYQPYRNREIPVVDEPVHYDVPLMPDLAATPDYTGTAIFALESNDGWNSGLLESGERYVQQLDTLGTYTYGNHENPAYLPLIIRNSN